MVATAQVQNQPLVSAYSRSAFSLIAVCFVLSGATGLIYEVLWARMLGLVFGATTIAISAVLSAFMGGLALGSEVAGRAGKQLHRPLRSYGLIEIGVGPFAFSVGVRSSRGADDANGSNAAGAGSRAESSTQRGDFDSALLYLQSNWRDWRRGRRRICFASFLWRACNNLDRGGNQPGHRTQRYYN